jgi:Tol biopolymer transport system component
MHPMSDRMKRFEALFHEALERSPSEREAFVKARCGDDTDLCDSVLSLLAQPASGASFALTDGLTAARVRVGQQLGQYRIESLIGAGGMGEVYRAHDSILGRDVALKVLSPLFHDEPERLARFRREARVLAALNHPHIATIHELREGDSPALIMELVDGPTLADRIALSPISVTESVAIGAQLAEALSAAHERGVIHRDLKPANIKLTREGRVKVLDFGLAKEIGQGARPGKPGLPGAHTEATLPPPSVMTRPHVVMGTAAYMSPEQARGQTVDSRTDIWSFGCVLFEMVTGRRAFDGDTASDTIVSILTREPDWAMLPAETPAPLRTLLRECLEKDCIRRLGQIRQASAQLDALRAAPVTNPPAAARATATGSDAPERAAPLRVATGRWLALATLAAVVLAAAVFLITRSSRSADAPVATPVAQPPEQLTNFPDSATVPSVSHDGRLVAFIRGADFGRTQPPSYLYVKALAGGQPRQLTTSRGAAGYPTFNPDDTRITYSTNISGEANAWDTAEVPVLGGTPQLFMKNASGLQWLDPTHFVYSSLRVGNHMGVMSSSANRENERTIYLPASEFGMAHRNTPSPDGRSLLVVEMLNGNWESCRLIPVDGSSAGKKVGPSSGQCTSANWSPDGHWMYFSSDNGGAFHIWRQAVPDGKPEQITFGPTEQEGTAITPDGRSLITSMGLQQASLSLQDDAGLKPLTDEGFAMQPVVTAKGDRVLYILRSAASRGRSTGELWFVDLANGGKQQVFPGITVSSFSVDRNAEHVLFTTVGQPGGDGLFVGDLLVREPPRRLVTGNDIRGFFGADLVIYRDGDGFIKRMRLDGSTPETVAQERTTYLLAVSPDGEWASVVRPRNDGKLSWWFLSLTGGQHYSACANCAIGPAGTVNQTVGLWNATGTEVFLGLNMYNSADRRTLVLPYQSGVPLEKQWPKRLETARDALANPGAHAIDGVSIYPGYGRDSSIVRRVGFQSNLYRIRLPQ